MTSATYDPKSGFQAKVIEHSVSRAGVELVTMQLRYPRFIHAEAKTHRMLSLSGEEYVELTQDASLMSDRMLSRNASSSRAIPVAKMIEQVRNEPAMPIHFGKNQPGMQARVELVGAELEAAKRQWLRAAAAAADHAEILMDIGAHKQVVNRILEPFQWISVIMTATELDNWDELRDHEDADPNIHYLASLMKQARADSNPVLRHRISVIQSDGWHLPYITDEERIEFRDDPLLLAKVSAARCARVSYLTHDGQKPDMRKDLELYERLVGSRPLHASPVEHQAHALPYAGGWCKNFRGWHQFREMVESEVKA